MFTKVKTTIVVSTLLFSSCKSGILISETNVPYEKICGSNAKFKCRSTGFGSNSPTYRIYEKERPSAEGKTSDFNIYNLGRADDYHVFNNTMKALELDKSDITVDTAKVDYDLKKNNITKILAELKSELKNQNINLDVIAQISNDFQNQLNNKLVIDAYIITYTIRQELIDTLRDAENGTNTDERFLYAVKSLKRNKLPLIREVKVIEEICAFNETTNLTNILIPILKATLGNDNPKVNIVFNGTISRQKTSVFSSSYKRTSIYSYGYFNDTWIMQ
jgi:hypothetical protein